MIQNHNLGIRRPAVVAWLMRWAGIDTPLYSPINEISFRSWAAGAEAYFNPCTRARGEELKQQRVPANIAGIRAIRERRGLPLLGVCGYPVFCSATWPVIDALLLPAFRRFAGQPELLDRRRSLSHHSSWIPKRRTASANRPKQKMVAST